MGVELTNIVCLVTGAGAGIGNGLVHGFLRRGAKVGAGLRDAEKSTPQILPALPLPMDVTDADQITESVAAVIGEFGRIDVLINNAGIDPRLPADELTYDEWRRVLDLNLDGAWRCCEAVIPHMKAQQSGVIINVGSIAFHSGFPHLTHYMASKGGIVGMTRGLARDLGSYGIRVNCVHLGAVQTDGERRHFPDEQQVLEQVNARQCLPGRLTPGNIEPVFAFLSSPDSYWITGQCLTVDGGWIHAG